MRLERELREELARGRREDAEEAFRDREERAQSANLLSQAVTTQVGQFGTLQAERLEAFARELNRFSLGLDERFERLKLTVEGRLTAIQADNANKLEEMRRTVDEKLHATLEQRLGESFKLVSDRLEQVHRGLGEMQTLAAGVGDLKRVLTNVKTRGTWGEVQLSALLEQLLTADQFAANVATRPGSSERVDFAIRLPGKDDGAVVWLPIDAKYPIEDYQRLLDAQERADPVAVEEASRAIETRLKNEAKSIHEKYVSPPHTTDFAMLYLPLEGLYAEALRRPGLAETLQRDFRVSIAGPTTLAALLNSLQMGFRTLAIEQRSAEVWAVLGAVKTEFGKFGEALAHTRKKLDEASNSIAKAETRTRQLSRKLKEVEALPAADAEQLIGVADFDGEDE
jgi:DNA recombination protein RmuC